MVSGTSLPPMACNYRVKRSKFKVTDVTNNVQGSQILEARTSWQVPQTITGHPMEV